MYAVTLNDQEQSQHPDLPAARQAMYEGVMRSQSENAGAAMRQVTREDIAAGESITTPEGRWAIVSTEFTLTLDAEQLLLVRELLHDYEQSEVEGAEEGLTETPDLRVAHSVWAEIRKADPSA